MCLDDLELRNSSTQNALKYLSLAGCLYLLSRSAVFFISIYDLNGKAPWCSETEQTLGWRAIFFRTACESTSVAKLLIPLSLVVVFFAAYAVATRRDVLFQSLLGILTGLVYISFPILQGYGKTMSTDISATRHIFFLLLLFLSIFRNPPIHILKLALPITLIFLAMTRFEPSWVLGNFFTSGYWCGYCGIPALIPVITNLAVLVGIIAPVLFYCKLRLIRYLGIAGFIVVETLLVDLGIGSKPDFFAYTIILSALFILYQDHPMRVSAKIPRLPFVGWSIIFILQLAGISGYQPPLFKKILPSVFRADSNVQCSLSLHEANQSVSETAPDENSIYVKQDSGVFATCTLAKLLPPGFIESTPYSLSNGPLTLTYDLSINGGNFCRTSFYISSKEDFLRIISRNDFHNVSTICTHKEIGPPVRNWLFARRAARSWAAKKWDETNEN